jgi:hypothetical protein
MMDEQEFEKLVWNIKKFGLLVPIDVDKDGVVLDGRCRYCACRVAGVVEPKFRTVETDDPVSFVLRANVLRHHRTPSQVAVTDALFAQDYPDHPCVLSEAARVVAFGGVLLDQVVQGALSLAAAYEEVLRREAEATRWKNSIARLQEMAPLLVLQTQEGDLTLEQAEDKIGNHVQALCAVSRHLLTDIRLTPALKLPYGETRRGASPTDEQPPASSVMGGRP